MKSIFLFLPLCVIALLTGCAAPFMFIGGVATGAIIADDRRDPATMLHDEEIELDISKAIDNDSQLRDKTHINVTSFNFIVLLSGQAPTTILRYQAESLVRKDSRVRLVYNEVVVGSPTSLVTRAADTMITTQVKREIFNNQHVNSNHVKVVTEKGTVFLMGILNRSEADQASNAARGVSGVVKVIRLFEFL